MASASNEMIDEQQFYEVLGRYPVVRSSSWRADPQPPSAETAETEAMNGENADNSGYFDELCRTLRVYLSEDAANAVTEHMKRVHIARIANMSADDVGRVCEELHNTTQ